MNALVALVLAYTAFQQGGTAHHAFTAPNVKAPVFAFAPTTGVGMGAACACTTPTGTKGETMTFTRGSSGTCLKGSTTTGINNGDMVTCTSNQPRVMPGGNGTGSLKLLMEESRTNSTLQSQALDNAAYGVNNSTSVNPVITANQATAIDNTLTADEVVVPAVSGSSYSQLFQVNACPTSGAGTLSFYIKGKSSNGTFDLDLNDGTHSHCGSCSYVSTSWTRCAVSTASMGAGSAFGMGSLTASGASCFDGTPLGAAADVYVWGVQCENGAFATSYIATTTVSVTRSADSAKFGGVAGVASAGSVAATVILEGPNINDGLNHPALISLNASGRYVYAWENIGARIFDGTNTFVQNLTFAANTSKRIYSFWSGSSATVGSFQDGLSTSGAFDGTMDVTNLYVGASDTAGEVLDGLIGEVCVDTSITRCH